MGKTVAAVVVVLLIIAGGAGFALNRNNKKEPTNAATTQTTPTESSTVVPDNQSAATQPNGTQPPSDAVNSQSVTIQNQAFNPGTLTVKAGTAVTWTNQDSMEHNVAPDKDYGDAFQGSELLSKGKSYTFTFTKAGTYTYHCTPHPFMQGTIVVTE